MTTPEGPPQRVRVTGPARRTGARPQGPGRGREIDEETRLGEVYMGSLLREQGRLAVRVLIVLFVSFGSLPLLFHFAPDLAGHRVLGMPLAWLLLGVLAYPFLLLLGWGYVRRAERNERDFAALVSGVSGVGGADQL